MFANLKNQILTEWAKAKNEHERGEVLAQIAAAEHEILVEYLHGEPLMRATIERVRSTLMSIARGNYLAPFYREHDPSFDVAPSELVGLASLISTLVVLRNERKVESAAELSPSTWLGYHRTRRLDATAARHVPARPGDSFTGFVRATDPLSVACRACGVAKGEQCSFPEPHE